MRKNLGIIFYYFFIVLITTVIANFIYIQYLGCTSLVAGKHLTITKELFVFGFFESFPVVILLNIISLLLYKIRHTANPVSGCIIFSVLCIVTWFGLFPFEEISRKIVFESENSRYKDFDYDKTKLSEGYFRRSKNRTYYFLQNASSTSAKVLMVNDTESPELFGDEMILLVNEKSNFSKQASPFKDPLVKETLYDMPYPLMNCFSVLKGAARNAWNNGIIAWICFCSLGFALGSAYSYIKASSWRLISVLYIIITESVVIGFNALYYSEPFMEMRKFMNELILGSDYSRLGFFYSRGVDFPLTILNVFTGLLVISLGIVFTSLSSKKEKYDEN